MLVRWYSCKTQVLYFCFHLNTKIIHAVIIQKQLDSLYKYKYDAAYFVVRNPGQYDIMTSFCVKKNSQQWVLPKVNLLVIKVPIHFPEIFRAPISVTKLTLMNQ